MLSNNVKEEIVRLHSDYKWYESATSTRLYIDDKDYSYETLNEQKLIILRRNYESYGEIKSKAICAFDTNKVVCIEQHDDKDYTYFITYGGESVFDQTITIYEDLTKWNDTFKELIGFKNVSSLEWINDHTLLIYFKNGEKVIYNIWLEKESCRFAPDTKIWFDEKLMDFIDPKFHRTVLIRENIAKGIAKDTITYGLDINDMDLATKTWSEEQRRYIKKYNISETIAYKKKHKEFIGNDIRKQCGELTYRNEIEKYLDLLDELGVSMPNVIPEKKVYDYYENGNFGLNIPYLKKLKRRYYVSNYQRKIKK